MKTAAYMAMAFGLASAFENVPRNLDEPCECDLEDPCYVAVQANKAVLCAPNVFSECDISMIPDACSGDSDKLRREAVNEACTCELPSTTTTTADASTETASTEAGTATTDAGTATT
ncbi:unnamed protein product, partial [Fusarium graminearum]